MKISKRKLINLIESILEADVGPHIASPVVKRNIDPFKGVSTISKKFEKKSKQKAKKEKFNEKTVEAIDIIKDAVGLDDILKVKPKDFFKMFPNLPKKAKTVLGMLSYIEFAIDPQAKIGKKGELGFILSPSMKAKLPKEFQKMFGLDRAFIKIKPPKKAGGEIGYEAKIEKMFDIPGLPKGSGLTLSLDLGNAGGEHEAVASVNIELPF